MNAPASMTPREAARELAKGAIADGFTPNGLHEYQDTNGKPTYWRIRCKRSDGEKWIRPMRLNGHGYTIGEPEFPNDKPLYNLPLIACADPAQPVFIVEGEACADALVKLGLIATTSGSSSSAHGVDWTPLSGRIVIVWPDHDEPGAKYAETVNARLRAAGAASVHVIEKAIIEALPEHGDCVDWLAQHPGATADDIRALPTVEPARADVMPEPEPLVTPTMPEPYPLDALPATIRAAVEEVRGFVQAPVALVASSALGALSLAAQSLADVKRADKLTGPCGLFLLTVADSGERKTTCDGFFSAAIREFQDQQAEAAKPLQKEYRAALNAWEAKQSGIKDALRAASKKGAPTAELESKLAALETGKPEAPCVPKLIRGDETPEHLAWLLAKDYPTGGVMSAEAGVVFGSHGMGKDSVMRNLALLNILWDGGTLSIGRKTSDSFDVRGARLTVALQVQEATLRSFFEQSGALARGTGFLARFLIAWPASTQGHRPFREAPKNWPALSAFNDRMARLLGQAQPLTDDYTLEPPLLAFAPEAKAAWVTFHDAIEAELRTGGELQDVRDVASKCADNAARLAALFHTFTGAGGAISVDSFESASRVAAWHLNEARRFFGELALPPEIADATQLERWLLGYCREHGEQSIPRRDVQRLGPLRSGDRLGEALDVLAGLNRAHLTCGGRRKDVELNPALLEGGTP